MSQEPFSSTNLNQLRTMADNRNTELVMNQDYLRPDRNTEVQPVNQSAQDRSDRKDRAQKSPKPKSQRGSSSKRRKKRPKRPDNKFMKMPGGQTAMLEGNNLQSQLPKHAQMNPNQVTLPGGLRNQNRGMNNQQNQPIAANHNIAQTVQNTPAKPMNARFNEEGISQLPTHAIKMVPQTPQAKTPTKPPTPELDNSNMSHPNFEDDPFQEIGFSHQGFNNSPNGFPEFNISKNEDRYYNNPPLQNQPTFGQSNKANNFDDPFADAIFDMQGPGIVLFYSLLFILL